MRCLFLTLSVAVACVALAQPVDAQFKLGIQGAAITSLADPTLEGTLGAGARLMLDPPLFPLALVGSGVYYFTDCGDLDCSDWTASLDPEFELGVDRLRERDGGPLRAMRYVVRTDPFVEKAYRQLAGTRDAFPRPATSAHIWEFDLPANLQPGIHSVVVESEDEFEQRQRGVLSFEVTEVAR